MAYESHIPVHRPTPTGRETQFGENEIIVSKTDTRGVITYANDVFMRVSGYSEAELIGKPHSILRHPSMPRCVFYLLWETIQAGKEIFAYVLNTAKNGDAYWVHAHVTPSHGKSGQIVGYHSNRRLPYPDALAKVRPLYATLLAEEAKHGSNREGMMAGVAMLQSLLASNNLTYDQFVFSLSEKTRLGNSIA